MAALIDRAVASAEVKAAAAARGLTTQQFPAATTPGGAWELRAAGHWMSGFFSGVMWQLHALTGKQAWADKAALWQAPLAERQRDWAAQHDFGARASAWQLPAAPRALHTIISAMHRVQWSTACAAMWRRLHLPAVLCTQLRRHALARRQAPGARGRRGNGMGVQPGHAQPAHV